MAVHALLLVGPQDAIDELLEDLPVKTRARYPVGPPPARPNLSDPFSPPSGDWLRVASKRTRCIWLKFATSTPWMVSRSSPANLNYDSGRP